MIRPLKWEESIPFNYSNKKCMKRKKISRPLYYQLSLALILCFFSMAAFTQVRISGKVTSAEGKGLPYISVVVKGTAFGSSTDQDGNYNFSADLKAGDY